jgi:hypothetical protein
MNAAPRALPWIYALLALTSVHHVYGAIHYGTPWRYHAVQLSAVTMAILVITDRLRRGRPGSLVGRVARWALVVVSWAIPVLFIGGFEGLYNHVLKDVLHFAGLPPTWMATMFPAPMYEMPNDLVFEISGVLQVVPAALAAYRLVGR